LVIFNTWPNHPNRIEPGKRPRTTLTPTLVLRDGRPVLAISVAGGDMQDQAALQILLNVIDFGMNAEQAYTAKRFSTNHFIGSFGQDKPHLASLDVYTSVSQPVLDDLKRRGHHITKASGNVGGVAMLYLDQATGIVSAVGGRSAGLE
jgi:gamma-glutamyltranspeptidase/glutathione hydrolase